jgi:hypothetical protein
MSVISIVRKKDKNKFTKVKKDIDKTEQIGYNSKADLKNGDPQDRNVHLIHGEVLKLAEEAPLLRV